jgi:EEF1A lysine methyltransferase 1
MRPARVCLLEYDSRFEMLEGFIKYDFNEPLDLPADLKEGFDRILWDPPYHSAACLGQCELFIDL